MLTADTPIISYQVSATPEQATQFILGREHGEYDDYDIGVVIVPAYFRLCPPVGLDPAMMIAHCIHETGPGALASWWAARPRRNAAGIGVTGRKVQIHESPKYGRTRPPGSNWAERNGFYVEGISFGSWADHAIPAHVGRVLAYALRDREANTEQLLLIKFALAVRTLLPELRGSAKTWKELGAAHNRVNRGRPYERWIGWAKPGTEYGKKIAEIAEAMRKV